MVDEVHHYGLPDSSTQRHLVQSFSPTRTWEWERADFGRSRRATDDIVSQHRLLERLNTSQEECLFWNPNTMLPWHFFCFFLMISIKKNIVQKRDVPGKRLFIRVPRCGFVRREVMMGVMVAIIGFNLSFLNAAYGNMWPMDAGYKRELRFVTQSRKHVLFL